MPFTKYKSHIVFKSRTNNFHQVRNYWEGHSEPSVHTIDHQKLRPPFCIDGSDGHLINDTCQLSMITGCETSLLKLYCLLNWAARSTAVSSARVALISWNHSIVAEVVQELHRSLPDPPRSNLPLLGGCDVSLKNHGKTLLSLSLSEFLHNVGKNCGLMRQIAGPDHDIQ